MFLEEYQCTIPASTLVHATMKKNHADTEQTCLIKVSMNFTEGKFTLVGDWQHLISANKHNELVCSCYHRKKVKIETDIYPSLVIDLEDVDNDGLLFSLQGSVTDEDRIGSCSGLLVLDNVRDSKGDIGNQWNVSFYLYDHCFENCEITFKLPVFADRKSSEAN